MKIFSSKVILKKLVSHVVFAFLILNVIPLVSFASEYISFEQGALTTKPADGTPSSDPNYGVSTKSRSYLLQNFELLTKMSCDIANNNNGSVTISGSTTTNQKVDKIGVAISLQKWDGSQWIDIPSVYSFSDTSSFIVTGSKSITITKGYYYRTKSIHSAQNGKIEESNMLYTDYILIPQ